MSAQYYGSYPVKRITAISIVGQGILIKTQKIVCKSSEVDSYLPTINSVFEDDSSLWVTDVKIDDQQNGLAEITVVAQGPTSNPSTMVEIQPGGVFIAGLKVLGEITSYPPASPSSGTTVKISFVDSVNNESNIISTYSLAPMPSQINGISLPPYTEPGIYGNISLDQYRLYESQNYRGNNNLNLDQNYRITYRGYICKDIHTQRQGSALSVALYYKESGYLEYVENIGLDTRTIVRSWEY
jgi:hypothetical protein